MSLLAAVEWGSVPAWISALTPLLAAGVVTRSMNRASQTIKEAVRATRPRTLRERLRALSQPLADPGPDTTGHTHRESPMDEPD